MLRVVVDLRCCCSARCVTFTFVVVVVAGLIFWLRSLLVLHRWCLLRCLYFVCYLRSIVVDLLFVALFPFYVVHCTSHFRPTLRCYCC